MADPGILLTNDDGIEATGFRALYDALTEVGDVTAVAPAVDQSAVGRQLSRSVSVSEHELGYEVEGTPADCVVAGLEVLVPESDLVVAGCNKGANLGAYVLGRSGTVSAAVESAFFDVPAMAVSLYVPIDRDATFGDIEMSYGSYTEATRAAQHLAEHAVGSGVFDRADYLNVNAPPAEWGPAGMAITRPSTVYRMRATHDGERIELEDEIWELMAAGDLPAEDGTDRQAVVDGDVSVSPLTAPHTTEPHDALDEIAAGYPT
ncbi:MAG: 5'/3'-nucleotidase SurE [Salinirussus sp.]